MTELRDDELNEINGGTGIVDYVLTWVAKYSFLDAVSVVGRPELGVGFIQDHDEDDKVYLVFFPNAKGGEKCLKVREDLLRKAYESEN